MIRVYVSVGSNVDRETNVRAALAALRAEFGRLVVSTVYSSRAIGFSGEDFYNLVEVYLDAVFYPLLAEHTLQQEGWHYELDSLEAPLTYKGIVFNEMKGNYSDPDTLLYKHVIESLFPDNVYHLDGGGDPAHIPDLTYEQFKAFHQTYYHPSNAYIFFYGDL